MSRTKFPRSLAVQVARELTSWLTPYCERLIFAGSLRRLKAEVGDIEVLYIPKLSTEPDGLFDTKQVNLVDRCLDDLIANGLLQKRKNVNGHETWGAKNKLAVHSSGIGIDFFEANAANWFNYLVCRTGSALTNTRIAAAALTKGWKWHPTRDGFSDEYGKLVRVESEQDVFRLVGLPYLEPCRR